MYRTMRKWANKKHKKLVKRKGNGVHKQDEINGKQKVRNPKERVRKQKLTSMAIVLVVQNVQSVALEIHKKGSKYIKV